MKFTTRITIINIMIGSLYLFSDLLGFIPLESLLILFLFVMTYICIIIDYKMNKRGE